MFSDGDYSPFFTCSTRNISHRSLTQHLFTWFQLVSSMSNTKFTGQDDSSSSSLLLFSFFSSLSNELYWLSMIAYVHHRDHWFSFSFCLFLPLNEYSLSIFLPKFPIRMVENETETVTLQKRWIIFQWFIGTNIVWNFFIVSNSVYKNIKCWTQRTIINVMLEIHQRNRSSSYTADRFVRFWTILRDRVDEMCGHKQKFQFFSYWDLQNISNICLRLIRLSDRRCCLLVAFLDTFWMSSIELQPQNLEKSTRRLKDKKKTSNDKKRSSENELFSLHLRRRLFHLSKA